MCPAAAGTHIALWAFYPRHTWAGVSLRVCLAEYLQVPCPTTVNDAKLLSQEVVPIKFPPSTSESSSPSNGQTCSQL